MKGYFLITGASSPLGVELSTELLKNRVPCIIIIRDKKKLFDLRPYDKSLYHIIESDLSCEKNVEKICAQIKDFKEKVKAFVHLAASAIEDDFNMEKMSYAFQVNVFSGWKLAKTCVQKMASDRGGRVLFVGSVGHKFGGKATRSGYSGSKFLLEYFPKIFRDCGADNILVNTIRLGVMKEGTQRVIGIDSAALIERTKLIPTGKAISHKEAVRNILFLCSEENKSIHNSVIACAGGE